MNKLKNSLPHRTPFLIWLVALFWRKKNLTNQPIVFFIIILFSRNFKNSPSNMRSQKGGRNDRILLCQVYLGGTPEWVLQLPQSSSWMWIIHFHLLNETLGNEICSLKQKMVCIKHKVSFINLIFARWKT